MKRKCSKGYMFVIVMILILGLLVGCTGLDSSKDVSQTLATNENNTIKSNTDDIKIGLSLKTVENPFVIKIKEGAADAAKDLGVEVITTDAQEDPQKQTQDIESLVQQGCQVIIVDAYDSQSIIPTLEDAVAAGVIIMTQDVQVPDAGDDIVTTHVGVDNYIAGTYLGVWLRDTLTAQDGGKVIVFGGIPGNEANESRVQGYIDEIQDVKNIEILEHKRIGYKREEGLAEMDDMLQKHSEIDAVICMNDELCLGAIAACEAAGREGIIMCGFDGTDDAITAIKNDVMAATVDQDPYTMTYTSVEVAKILAEGGAVDSKYEIPCVVIDENNVNDY